MLNATHFIEHLSDLSYPDGPLYWNIENLGGLTVRNRMTTFSIHFLKLFI